GRPPPVPVPRRVAAAAGRGEVRPGARPRRAPRRVPRAGLRAPGGPRAHPAARARRRRPHARRRLLPGRRRGVHRLVRPALRVEHITCHDGIVTCRYPAKGGKRREQVLADAQVCAVVRALCARGEGELLRYREDGVWRDVRSADINAYLKEVFGEEVSAKDFRTWHATVLAAVGLAVSGAVRGGHGQKRAVARVMREVAEY